jgi:glutathione S-transferase
MSIQSLLPDGYGFAAFLWIPGMYMFHWVLSGSVISARKEFNVKLPNLYAVPGVHKKADEFNAVQRGHMNMMETNHYLQLMALFGSCYSSNAAYANAVGGVANMVGCSLYMKAYKKYYNVEAGRYKTGGAIKYIAHLIGLVTSSMVCLQLLGVL